MKLRELCEMRFWYTTPFHLVQPFGTEEGVGWGAGEGRVSGERFSGSLQWVNHPRRRSDATMLPDADGVITTDDGAKIIFRLEGRTPTVGDDAGKQLLRFTFHSQEEQYAWLNLTFAVAEGVIDLSAEPYAMVARVYELVHDLRLE